jgi:hypothetical protein
MARYTCSFVVSLPWADLESELIEIFKSCNFDLIYQTHDYLLAREKPGQVSFAQLVTTEVLIDRTHATHNEIRLDFVVKNEELPLQLHNHCRQLFDLIHQAITDGHDQWHLVANQAN